MKKIFALIIVCVLIGIGSSIQLHNFKIFQSTQVVQKSSTSNSANITPTATVGNPTEIHIPSLGVTATVENVGLDSKGRMDVPLHALDVGWYRLGFKPGEKGSAVIDGHYDTVTGAPAVFYYISSLTPGQRIDVTDTSGKTYIFSVTYVTSYPYDQLPLRQIFDTTDKPRLNLITCNGTWDKLSKNYSQRAVVYSVLQSVE